MIECNADLDHPCDVDDGDPCPECLLERRAAWAEFRRDEFSDDRRKQAEVRRIGT